MFICPGSDRLYTPCRALRGMRSSRVRRGVADSRSFGWGDSLRRRIERTPALNRQGANRVPHSLRMGWRTEILPRCRRSLGIFGEGHPVFLTLAKRAQHASGRDRAALLREYPPVGVEIGSAAGYRQHGVRFAEWNRQLGVVSGRRCGRNRHPAGFA